MLTMTIERKDNQTFFDLAVQYAGDAAAAYDIARLAGLSVTDTPPRHVEIPETPNAIVADYFSRKNMVPATFITDADIAKLQL